MRRTTALLVLLAGVSGRVPSALAVDRKLRAEVHNVANSPVASKDVYEVTLVVTAVRFVDNSVWMAPRQIVQDLFFPDAH